MSNMKKFTFKTCRVAIIQAKSKKTNKPFKIIEVAFPVSDDKEATVSMFPKFADDQLLDLVKEYADDQEEVSNGSETPSEEI